jgi:type VI secretion system FHA domain protein
MKLILRLTDHDRDTGESRTLETGRLNIGRGAENDWVLADPDRTLSKNHCRIDASDGGFMLTDLSTNGVFLAGAGQPVGRGRSCALEQGDSFMIGPYWIHADIVDEEGETLVPRGLGLPQGDMEEIFPGAKIGSGAPVAASAAEPWLPNLPSGGFGPDRRAAPQGWDAPPDPAAYAATGLFEAPAPLEHAGLFSHQSEHIPASGTVMRLPAAQIVLPVDWNEQDAAAQDAASAQAAEAPWPPPLPDDATSIQEEVLPANWVAPKLPSAASILPADWAPEVTGPAARSRPEPPPSRPAAAFVPAPVMPPPVPVAAVETFRPAPPRRASPAPAPPPKPVPAPAPVAKAEPEADPSSLLHAFLDGAGLAPGTLDEADLPAAFREIGQMVRAAVEGARDILSTRALVKSEFRVDQTVLRRSDNNAMKFAPDAQKCMAAMVGAAPPGFLPGAAAMQQSMDDIKAHELALVAALNTVFADLDRQLDPEAIMRKAREDQSFSTMLPYAREAKCWAIYVAAHKLLQDSGASNTGGSLLAPLAQAYARHLRRGG